jgi:hypothetical protein
VRGVSGGLGAQRMGGGGVVGGMRNLLVDGGTTGLTREAFVGAEELRVMPGKFLGLVIAILEKHQISWMPRSPHKGRSTSWEMTEPHIS